MSYKSLMTSGRAGYVISSRSRNGLVSKSNSSKSALADDLGTKPLTAPPQIVRKCTSTTSSFLVSSNKWDSLVLLLTDMPRQNFVDFRQPPALFAEDQSQHWQAP